MKNIIFFLSALLTLSAKGSFEYEHVQNSISKEIHVLRVDPKEYLIKLLPALDDGLGVESVASMCLRKGAKAGINGSFFEYDNKYTGLPRWTSKMGGKYFSISNHYHPAFGWSKDGKVTLFDHIKAKLYLRQNKKMIPLNGMNGALHKGETLLFTPWFHRTTLTPFQTEEIIISNGKVEKVAEVGSNLIPENGFILSTTLNKPVIDWGAKDIDYKIELTPETDTGKVGEWGQVEHIVSSFPLLLKDGKRHLFKGEGPGDYTVEEFIKTHHPRTAVGVREDGTWIIVVVDGGAESHKGISLHDLAVIMEKEGCLHAINLDGGGSSSLVIDGEYKNLNGQNHEERRVGNALLFFPRNNHPN